MINSWLIAIIVSTLSIYFYDKEQQLVNIRLYEYIMAYTLI